MIDSRTARAVGLLTLSTIRRLLREGMVLRSLVWPGVVVVGTLTVTVAILAFLRPSRDVGVTPGTDAAVVAALSDGGFEVHEVADARTAVEGVAVPAATDGRTLWVRGTSTTALEVEEIVRTALDAPWRPSPPDDLPDLEDGRRQGRVISRVLGMLFVMYGTVFGLGSVARDRDDGTLEAELALPVPRWVGGLARWIASTVVLAVFYALCILMLAAIIGVDEPGAAIRHGTAACAGGVAIGLGVVGTAGIKQGFSGPFAAGLTAVTGLATLGGATGIGWVPIASLFGGGSGWGALACGAGFGAAAAWIYARRTGRA